LTRLSERISGLKESATLAITARAKALRAEGRDIIPLGAGEPDFDTPENIKEAAIKAIRDGRTKYTPVGGIPELKDAVREKFDRDNGLAYSRDEVIISCGGKHSFYNLIEAVIDPGDEVLMPSPYWVSYPAIVGLAGGTPVGLRTDEADGFKLSPGTLAGAVTPRSKALVINSPSNPAGVAYTASELAALAEVALEHGLLIISDEIYEKLVYDGFRSTSIASVSDEVRERTVVLNGVSKAYSMTGWRIGYAAGPSGIIEAMTRIQSQSTSNPASISQWAAVEALCGPQGSIEKMLGEFHERRDVMVEGLEAIDGVSAPLPRGAFYVFANISKALGKSHGTHKIGSSIDLAAYLLDIAGVAVVPGEPFGNDSCVRVSFATSIDNVRQGVARMAEAIARLS